MQKSSFYAVSISKLIIMSTLTFGLYDIYWAYKHWKMLEDRNGIHVLAAVRALFLRFFLWSLARHTSKLTKSSHFKKYHPVVLGISYFILTMLWRAPEPYDWFSFLSTASLIPIQMAINEYAKKEEPTTKISSSYSKKEIIMLLIGGMLLLFSVADSLLIL